MMRNDARMGRVMLVLAGLLSGMASAAIVQAQAVVPVVMVA